MLLTPRSATEDFLGPVIGWMPASFTFSLFSLHYLTLVQQKRARELTNFRRPAFGTCEKKVSIRATWIVPKTPNNWLLFYYYYYYYYRCLLPFGPSYPRQDYLFRFCGHCWHQSGDFPYDSPTGAVWQFNSKWSRTGYRVVAGSSMCRGRRQAYPFDVSFARWSCTPYTLLD